MSYEFHTTQRISFYSLQFLYTQIKNESFLVFNFFIADLFDLKNFNSILQKFEFMRKIKDIYKCL